MNSSYKVVMLITVLLYACASPTVVQSVKPGDQGLSCAQLQNEFADAERFRSLAQAEKTVTGGNVARALLFWPAILGTAANANEAISAADARKVHLANQMNQKNCPIQITPQVTTLHQNATAPSPQTPPTIEEKLNALKRLYDANLISKEVYTDKQKEILDSQKN